MEPENLHSTSAQNDEWVPGDITRSVDGKEASIMSNVEEADCRPIIDGRDMALLQRPLLESPSGSYSSKAVDSIGGSSHGKTSDSVSAATVSKNDEPDTDTKDFAGASGCVEMTDTGAGTRLVPSVSVNIETPSKHATVGIEHSDVHSDKQSENYPFDSVSADIFKQKRDRSGDYNLPHQNTFHSANPAKKIRNTFQVGEVSSFSSRKDTISDSKQARAANAHSTEQCPAKKSILGDGAGIVNKISESSAKPGLFNDIDQDRLAAAPAPPLKIAVPDSGTGIFDDAEDDEIVDFLSSKQPAEKTADPPIRPDLVAAILGTPPRPQFELNASKLATSFALSRAEDTNFEAVDPKKKIAKPPKRVWTSKKEQDAAAATLRGKIDLLQILPHEDCQFLGNHCSLFTLQQLEFVLKVDESAESVLLRRNLQNRIAEKLFNAEVDTEKNKDANWQSEILESKMLRSTSEAEKYSEAGKKMDEWRSAMKTRRLESNTRDCDDQFPLSGPLAQFIPAGTRQFFESINLKNAFEFLSLKKTETGLVVELFQAWRGMCDLKTIQPLALAKHLLGLNTRIELALGSKSGIPANDIKWIKDGLVILSGAAKEFIIDDCKIFSAEHFVEMRTKSLADKLSDWRAAKGLPVLKGSGKVAMISAWKSLLKEEVEIEKALGRVIPENELKKYSNSTDTMEIDCKKRKIPATEERPKKRAPKETQPRYTTQRAKDALNSDALFIEVFGEDERNMKMFNSVGITTPQKLLDADKGQNSDFLKAVLAMKADRNSGKAQTSSCIRLLYNWAAKMKARIDEIEQGKEIGHSNNRPKSESSLSVDARSGRAQSICRDLKLSSSDPFDALSSSSKEFLLESMDITTAAQFLSARTTDIANAFIQWRASKNMAALKGLGAVASVSGWKNLVRKKAAALGDERLALLNQASNSKNYVHGKPTTKEKSFDQLGKFPGTPEKYSMKGQSEERKKFIAMSHTGDTGFHFELSSRSSDEGDRYFLTYLGSDTPSAVPHRNTYTPCTSEASLEKPVMVARDANTSTPREKRPYDSLTFGMIELGSCGVVTCQADRDTARVLLEEEICKFVLISPDISNDSSLKDREGKTFSETSNHVNVMESRYNQYTIKYSTQERPQRPQTPFNVFEERWDGAWGSFLRLVDPIEKGQSVELLFSPYSRLEFGSTSVKARKWIDEMIGRTSIGTAIKIFDMIVEKIDAPLSRNIERSVQERLDGRDGSAILLPSKDLVLSRRRLHWILTRIDAKLASSNGGDEMTKPKRESLRRYLWRKDTIDSLRRLPDWSIEIVRDEIKEELEYEMTITEVFSDFFATRRMWCSMATELLDWTICQFAGFMAGFDTFCTEDELSIEICRKTSHAIADMKQAKTDGTNAEALDLNQFALSFESSEEISPYILPSAEEVINHICSQAYGDAMHLCDEPTIPLTTEGTFRAVATKGRSGELGWKSQADAEADEDMIHVKWYAEKQIVVIIQGVLKCIPKTLFTGDDTSHYLSRVESQVINAARSAVGDQDVAALTLEIRDQRKNRFVMPVFSQEEGSGRNEYKPHSSVFFHGFIWPVLRKSGWRLAAGESPSDVVYTPPQSALCATRRGGLKDKIARQRVQFARETGSIGLGYVSKLSKRLLVKAVDGAGKASTLAAPNKLNGRKCGTSAGAVINAFRCALSTALAEEVMLSECAVVKEKAEMITEAICSIFNMYAPLAIYDDEDFTLNEDQEWSDVLGCQYLLRILFAFPLILQQTELPSQQQELILSVVRELLEFVTRNHKIHFDGSLCLAKEVYEEEPRVPRSLLKRIVDFCRCNADNGKTVISNPSGLAGESIEIVRSDDCLELTDFISAVMEQTIISHATAEDTLRKNRRISVGYPCIVCRHCLGRHGEGKYFFGSIESMTTAATVIEKHLLRCPDIDSAIKAKLVASRAKHSDQRKGLPSGAQGAFFASLFDRLQSMRPEAGSINASFAVAQSLDDEESEHNESDVGLYSTKSSSAAVEGYRNHVDVMEFLQSSEPWQSMEDLAEASEKYYNCLEYGGKIVTTKRSPANFSSEWLYAKIAPR